MENEKEMSFMEVEFPSKKQKLEEEMNEDKELEKQEKRENSELTDGQEENCEESLLTFCCYCNRRISTNEVVSSNRISESFKDHLSTLDSSQKNIDTRIVPKEKTESDDPFEETAGLFVDNSLELKSFLETTIDKKKTLLISAPLGYGKCPDILIDMVKRFLELEINDKGDPIINVKKSQVTGKWKENKEQTKKFQLFKSLKIFQCQHEPKHTEYQCMKGECDHRNFFYEHCGQYPLIAFNLKELKDPTYSLEEYFESYFKNDLLRYWSEIFRKYTTKNFISHLEKSKKELLSQYVYKHVLDMQLFTTLEFMAECLNERFKRKAFVLVENFNYVISNWIQKKEASLDFFKFAFNFLGEMMAPILKENKNVAGVVIQASPTLEAILSQYANTVKSCLFLDNHGFADYSEFQETEEENLPEKHSTKNIDNKYLSDFKQSWEREEDGIINRLRISYTYTFMMYFKEWTALRKNIEKQNMYTRKLLLKKDFIKSKKILTERGVIKLESMFSINKIRERIFDLQEYGSLEISNMNENWNFNQFFFLKELFHKKDEPTDEEITLFFHYFRICGYLCVTEMSENEKTIKLEIPNLQIASLFTNSLYTTYFYKTTLKRIIRTDDYIKALGSLKGNKKYSFKIFVQSIVNMFPLKRPSRPEELKGILFCIASQNSFPKVECKTFVVGGKREMPADLLIVTGKGTGIIVEIAAGPKDEQDALLQIFNCNYSEYLAEEDCMKQKIYIGLNYNYDDGSAKICAYVTEGNIVTEQLNDNENFIRFGAKCPEDLLYFY